MGTAAGAISRDTVNRTNSFLPVATRLATINICMRESPMWCGYRAISVSWKSACLPAAKPGPPKASPEGIETMTRSLAEAVSVRPSDKPTYDGGHHSDGSRGWSREVSSTSPRPRQLTGELAMGDRGSSKWGNALRFLVGVAPVHQRFRIRRQ